MCVVCNPYALGIGDAVKGTPKEEMRLAEQGFLFHKIQGSMIRKGGESL